MTTSTGTVQRTAPHRVLAGFVPPGTAARLAAPLDDGDAGLAAVVDLLRARLGVADELLVVALHLDGDAPVSTITRLTGVDARTVNELLDHVEELDEPAAAHADDPSPRARAIGRARTVVRLVWAVLLAMALVASVQARGGLFPCPEVVCLSRVELVLAEGEPASRDGDAAVAGPDGAFGPTDVLGIRYHHRSTDGVALTFVWRAEGEDVLVQRAQVAGSGSTVIAWPGGSMPEGVHTVDVLDGDELLDRTTFTVALDPVD